MVTLPIHLPVVFSVSFFHVSEATAEPLDRCLKQCFHLFHLVARHVFFSQHGSMLACLVLQHSDLRGVIALASQCILQSNSTPMPLLSHLSTTVEGLFRRMHPLYRTTRIPFVQAHVVQIRHFYGINCILRSIHLVAKTCSPVLLALRRPHPSR